MKEAFSSFLRQAEGLQIIPLCWQLNVELPLQVLCMLVAYGKASGLKMQNQINLKRFSIKTLSGSQPVLLDFRPLPPPPQYLEYHKRIVSKLPTKPESKTLSTWKLQLWYLQLQFHCLKTFKKNTPLQMLQCVTKSPMMKVGLCKLKQYCFH